jgi:hypothetical protein
MRMRTPARKDGDPGNTKAESQRWSPNLGEEQTAVHKLTDLYFRE